MKTDVLIVGGGPAGSASAMNLLAQGITPAIVEAETFPRDHNSRVETMEQWLGPR